MNPDDITKVYNESDCLFDADNINAVLTQMAEKITADLKDKNPLILCVMTGGVIPTGHLLTRLTFPLQLDYVHATRYRGETKGGELHWLHEPSVSMNGRVVLIVDDIFDEGVTLKAIAEYCRDKGATHVHTAVLVDKLHTRKADFKVDYIGVEIEDRYLFGFGMDYKNYLRNINGIHAVIGL
jgi:hypoxanthine phosphoribosyltransferase